MTAENINENFENPEDESFRKEILGKFTDYRNNYIDDLPPERLKTQDKNYYKHKCRGSFLHGVAIDIDNLINEGILKNPDAIEKGKEYIEHIKSREGFSKLSTQDDINKVNEILDIMINELS